MGGVAWQGSPTRGTAPDEPGKREQLKKDWAENPRWKGIKRGYTAEDVVRLRGSVQIEHTLAKRGAREALEAGATSEPFVNSLGALTGNQAMQQVKAGLKAIYLSGWQVAADANDSPADVSRPVALPGDLGADGREAHQQRASRAPTRSSTMEGKGDIDCFAPIVADAEAGFGGVLNAFELMKAMIEAGAAGVHFEDQLASVKKCGHMGGKVLVPTQEAVQKLIAARLAADVMGVPTVLLARTDAEAADLVTTRRRRERQAVPHRRAHRRRASTRRARASTRRSRAASPTRQYADLVWCETGTPDLAFAKTFAEGDPARSSRARCWPTTARRRSTGRRTSTTRPSPSSSASSARWATSSSSSRWPASTRLNYSMFELAHGYARNNMSAFVELQEKEFAAAEKGFTAVKHQREVGTGYFDAVTTGRTGGKSSTTALHGSTEDEQFFDSQKKPKLAAA